MDPVDEQPIRKFASLQTGKTHRAQAVILPGNTVVHRDWLCCVLAKILSDRMIFDQLVWKANVQSMGPQTDIYFQATSKRYLPDRMYYQGWGGKDS